MRNKHFTIITFLLLSLVLLSGCAGGASRAASSWPGLSADSETVYIAYNKFVYAVNLGNGVEKWRFPLEGDNKVSYFATPIKTTDGQLLVGDYNNTLHSLNSSSGQENWAFTQATDRYIGSALEKDGSLFAPNAGNQIYALNTNGNKLWEFITDGPLWAQPTTNTECDCIYIPSMDHSLYAVNAQSGTQEWKSEKFGGSIVGIPAISPDGMTIYVGTFGNQVLAISSSDGSVIWEALTDNYVWGGPVLSGERLYATDQSGMVYSIEARTGSIGWQYETDGKITGSPLVTEDTIYIGTESGTLYAMDLDGNIRWTKQYAGKLYTTPVLGSDVILVASTDSDELVYALDSNGNPKWTFIPAEK